MANQKTQLRQSIEIISHNKIALTLTEFMAFDGNCILFIQVIMMHDHNDVSIDMSCQCTIVCDKGSVSLNRLNN